MTLNVLTLHNVVLKQLCLLITSCRCLMSHLTVTSLLWVCIFSFFNNALIASCMTWVIWLTVLITEFYSMSSANRRLVWVHLNMSLFFVLSAVITRVWFEFNILWVWLGLHAQDEPQNKHHVVSEKWDESHSIVSSHQ